MADAMIMRVLAGSAPLPVAIAAMPVGATRALGMCGQLGQLLAVHQV